MNKIFNWTFGSLFRTIGRLLGFLIVFILLLLIGSKLGLKIPDFLMPMKISLKAFTAVIFLIPIHPLKTSHTQ